MHIEKGADFLVTQERGTPSPSPPTNNSIAPNPLHPATLCL